MNRIESLQRFYADYPDPIVVEATILKFKALDPHGKIQLLEKLHQSFWDVPHELGQVASRDDNAVVRLWAAAHWRFVDFKGDPDDLVHATAVAHSEFRRDTESEREEKFKDLPPNSIQRRLTYFHWDTATVRERLAFLRRDDFGYLADLHVKPLILKLFDPTNELVSDLDERKQYALAFLTSRAGRLREVGKASSEGPDLTSAQFGAKVIELMPLWPYETGIQDFVYRFCSPYWARLDAVYQYCSEPLWRRYLLENVFQHFRYWMPGESLDRMLELARQDPDDECRELAYRDPFLAAVHHISTFRRAVRSSDLATLRGLAKNRGLSRRQLKRFRRRFKGWYVDIGDEVSNTIAYIKYRHPWQNHREMFPEFEVRDIGEHEPRISARDKRTILFGLVLREYWIVTLAALAVGLIVLIMTERMAPVFVTVAVTIWVGLGRTLYKSAVMLEVLDDDNQRTPDTADLDLELHHVRVAIEGNSFKRDKEIDPVKEKERIASYKAALDESRQKDEVARSKEASFFKPVLEWLLRLLYT